MSVAEAGAGDGTAGVPDGAGTGGRMGGRLFTVHVDFLAADEREARSLAWAYVEASNTLRPEVDCYGAHVSAEADWTGARALACREPGPDPADVCLREAGHDGDHRGPGPTSAWGDTQVPTVPDSLEGLC